MAARRCWTDRAGVAHAAHLGAKPIRTIPRPRSVVGSGICSQDLSLPTSGFAAFAWLAVRDRLALNDGGDDAADHLPLLAIVVRVTSDKSDRALLLTLVIGGYLAIWT